MTTDETAEKCTGEAGASLLEYALLICVVSLLSLGAVSSFGLQSENRLQTAVASLTQCGGGTEQGDGLLPPGECGEVGSLISEERGGWFE